MMTVQMAHPKEVSLEDPQSRADLFKFSLTIFLSLRAITSIFNYTFMSIIYLIKMHLSYWSLGFLRAGASLLTIVSPGPYPVPGISMELSLSEFQRCRH